MKSFWNTTTIIIAICAVSLPLINIYVSYISGIENFGIANSIALFAIFITVLSTLYSNYKNDINIKKQMKKSEETLFIQLRFDDAKQGINDLIIYLESTLGLYDQLEKLNKSNIDAKEQYLSPRAFLVMQFINIISNYELLLKLPITLRTQIQTLINDEYLFLNIKDDERFKNLLQEYGFENDYTHYFNIIKSKNPPKVIQNYLLYTKFISEFNNAPDYEMHESVFRYYYGFKKIKTKDFYNHFYDIYLELTTKSVENIILKDKIE